MEIKPRTFHVGLWTKIICLQAKRKLQLLWKEVSNFLFQYLAFDEKNNVSVSRTKWQRKRERERERERERDRSLAFNVSKHRKWKYFQNYLWMIIVLTPKLIVEYTFSSHSPHRINCRIISLMNINMQIF